MRIKGETTRREIQRYIDVPERSVRRALKKGKPWPHKEDRERNKHKIPEDIARQGGQAQMHHSRHGNLQPSHSPAYSAREPLKDVRPRRNYSHFNVYHVLLV